MKMSFMTGSLASSLLLATTLSSVHAADMTFERALKADAEPQNWILHHQNYAAHRYSRLNEINQTTIKNLRVAWTVALGGFQSGGRYESGNLEVTPIVEDGMMYVTDGWGSVYGMDIKNGRKADIKWKMDPGTDRAWAGDVACCGVNNRGVALWKDKIVSVGLDGRLFLINKATGEMIWERKVAEPALGETITAAPLVVRDKAIVGSAGGEFGIRGYLDGTDLNTGKAAWRTFTIPGKGEPGNETWKDGKDHWMHGGASVWVTPTYDSALDTFYVGVGNAGPDYDPEFRPGDNKWAASVLAIAPEDGKIRWGFQYTPNDPYDYDEISEHPLIDAKVNGQDRKLVTHGARNGFYYVLDRTNGTFVNGKQYIDKLTWTTGLDPKTGLPLEYDPKKDVQDYVMGSHGTRAKPLSNVKCPTTTGGKNWEPAAFNPDLNLMYLPTAEGCNMLEMQIQADFADQGGTVKPRDRFTGGSGKAAGDVTGAIKALDPVTGELKATARWNYPNWSGILATSGNLIFAGWIDGEFKAYDGKTLQEVWSFNTGCGIKAPPVSYSINGKQYISVAAGPFFLGTKPPELKNYTTCSMIYTFTL